MSKVILGLFFGACLTSAIPAQAESILGQMFGVPPRSQTYAAPAYGDAQKAASYGYRNLADYEADTAMAQQAEARALNGGTNSQPVRWYNPRTRNSGVISVVDGGQNQMGWPCLTLSQTINIFGNSDQRDAAACRSPQGYWQPARTDR